MPELPEVETTRRGIEPWLLGRRVAAVDVRERRLRWPVPAAIRRELPGAVVRAVRRRAKYLLIVTDAGTAIVHLGMSGSLRIAASGEPPGPHDHVDLVLEDGYRLRLRDPRRFGSVLWTRRAAELHPLLRRLGPEPLEAEFTGEWLHARARGRRLAVKSFLMDGRIVAGVGNIYANEALYLAGVHPARAAGRIACDRYRRLARTVRALLGDAIERGGTTLRDYVGVGGAPGEFALRLRAYGRAGAPCERCGGALRGLVVGQRATVYCPACQR